jgi:general secretion pathway protein H
MAARGFTLIEMLVVLTILALVMVLVPPFLAGGQARAEFTATAQQIAAALRDTRGLAIRRGHTATFAVDFAAGAYGTSDGGRIRHVPKGLRLLVYTPAGEPVGTDIGVIRFFADGSSTGGEVRLLQGERRSNVRVDWLTGRVSLETGAAAAPR